VADLGRGAQKVPLWRCFLSIRLVPEEGEGAIQEVYDASRDGEKYDVYHKALQHAKTPAHDEQKLRLHEGDKITQTKTQIALNCG